MKNKRTDRLNSELRKLIYEVIKNKLMLPEVTEMFTVTEVDCAPDLKSARVYLSVYSTNEEKRKKTFDAICHASSEIRRALCAEMRIRTVPELRFYEDGAFAYGNKIDTILSTLTYGDNNDGNDDSN
jgi:ribosome-binding factor A